MSIVLEVFAFWNCCSVIANRSALKQQTNNSIVLLSCICNVILKKYSVTTCPFLASVLALTVQESWSCAIQTLSFAKGKQTLGVKTHVWGWCFACTSTSPMAGQCLYRLLPTPSNAVSLTHKHINIWHVFYLGERWHLLLLSNKLSLLFYYSWSKRSTSALSKLYVIKQVFAKAIDALYMMPDTRVIYLKFTFYDWMHKLLW